MLKCSCCYRVANVVFDNELFCERHHNSKNTTKKKQGYIRKTPPKTGLESELKKKYTKKLDRCIFPDDYEQLNIEFKKDVQIIIQQNPIYKNNQ